MKLLRKYYFLIIIFVFAVIFLINYQSYQRATRIIQSENNNKIELIENIILSNLQNAYSAYSISEVVLNHEMRENSKLLLKTYQHNSQVNSWDLIALQAQMPDYEIYIINSDLQIIKTTLKADLGLDFSRFPEFSKLLTNRLNNDSFSSDKFDLALNVGAINKYSYQPTADHKYLLELSIDITKRFPVLDDFNIFAVADEITKQYPIVKKINFYKFSQNVNKIGLISSTAEADQQIATFDRDLIQQAVLNNQVINYHPDSESEKISYSYIPFLVSNTDSDWWNSFALRVSYNNQSLLEQIQQEWYSFLSNLIVILIVFIIFSVLMSYFITKTERIAYTDYLTGLANRKAFEEYFNKYVAKNMDKKLAILYLDLDGFKEVNDSYGHDTGDFLLKAVAKRLKNNLRSNDQVARMGGDEFTVMLTNVSDEDKVKNIINMLENKLTKPYYINGYQIKIGCSFGYSIDYCQRKSFKDLINTADLAMYQVKNQKIDNLE